MALTIHNDHLVVHSVDRPATITRTLAGRDLYICGLTPVAVDLEAVFLQLTGTTPVAGVPRQVDESVRVPAGAGAAPTAVTSRPGGAA
jgi:ABC-2 type transport system ATP-binding protein